MAFLGKMELELGGSCGFRHVLERRLRVWKSGPCWVNTEVQLLGLIEMTDRFYSMSNLTFEESWKNKIRERLTDFI